MRRWLKYTKVADKVKRGTVRIDGQGRLYIPLALALNLDKKYKYFELWYERQDNEMLVKLVFCEKDDGDCYRIQRKSKKSGCEAQIKQFAKTFSLLGGTGVAEWQDDRTLLITFSLKKEEESEEIEEPYIWKMRKEELKMERELLRDVG